MFVCMPALRLIAVCLVAVSARHFWQQQNVAWHNNNSNHMASYKIYIRALFLHAKKIQFNIFV